MEIKTNDPIVTAQSKKLQIKRSLNDGVRIADIKYGLMLLRENDEPIFKEFIERFYGKDKQYLLKIYTDQKLCKHDNIDLEDYNNER